MRTPSPRATIGVLLAVGATFGPAAGCSASEPAAGATHAEALTLVPGDPARFADHKAFLTARGSPSVEGYERYLREYPSGLHGDEARAGMCELAVLAARKNRSVEHYGRCVQTCRQGARRTEAVIGALTIAYAPSPEPDAAELQRLAAKVEDLPGLTLMVCESLSSRPGPGVDAACDALLGLTPETARRFAGDLAIRFVGPRGWRVKDIIAMRGGALSDDVIATKIVNGKLAYKDFSFAELSVLKGWDLPDSIVRAMLESTAHASDERRAQIERDLLHAEIAELRRRVEENKAKPPDEKQVVQTVQTRDGLMDVAACMAKRLGALSLCGRLPWPASTVCRSGGEAAFPCK